MAALLNLFTDSYKQLMSTNKDSWPLMGSPVPMITILVVYVAFSLKLGPMLMHKREALDLKKVLIAYNSYQIVMNALLLVGGLVIVSKMPYLFVNCKNPIHNEELDLEFFDGMWWYLFSRIMDMIDTVLFVLRRKQSQVTPLHVYHHVSLALLTWLFLKYTPAHHAITAGILNSLVHMIMYGYYLISGLGPKYAKYLWWKRYLTCLQMMQFAILVVYGVYLTVMDCNVPKPATYVGIPYGFIFLYLFLRFYRKTYNNQENRQTADTSIKQE